MDDGLKIAFALAYGYLLGSFNLAYVVARYVKGVDLRKVGTGTVGASNIWYNVSRKWIYPVGLFDLFVKGMTPAFVARGLGLDLAVQVLAALLVIVGHNWSVFLGFQGGRGVAPTTGVLLALGRLELSAFVIIGTAGWRMTNSSAVWVLLGFGALPFLALWWDRPLPIVLLMAGIFGITVLKRLASNSLRGTGVSLPRLLLNRLIWDRDIADHDAWVRRTADAGE
jgi:glycerol-3-phosphate acyltransferase PlsY